MAAVVFTKTRPITREKLGQWLPSHEARRYLENLGSDVTETLPSGLEQVNEAVLEVAVRASNLESEVSVLQAQVISLQDRVSTLEAQLSQVQDQSVSLLADLREQINVARVAINDLHSGPTP